MQAEHLYNVNICVNVWVFVFVFSKHICMQPHVARPPCPSPSNIHHIHRQETHTTHLHIYLFAYTCLCAWSMCVRVCLSVCVRVCACMLKYTCIHIYTACPLCSSPSNADRTLLYAYIFKLSPCKTDRIILYTYSTLFYTCRTPSYTFCPHLRYLTIIALQSRQHFYIYKKKIVRFLHTTRIYVWCVCTYVCTCINWFECVCVHVLVLACVRVYVCACVCLCVYLYTHTINTHSLSCFRSPLARAIVLSVSFWLSLSQPLCHSISVYRTISLAQFAYPLLYHTHQQHSPALSSLPHTPTT